MYVCVKASDVIMFTLNWTGLVEMDIRFTVPESKTLTVEDDEELMTYLRERAREVKRHDQEPIKQAVHGYKQAAGKIERDFNKDKHLTAIKERLMQHTEMLVPYNTKILRPLWQMTATLTRRMLIIDSDIGELCN